MMRSLLVGMALLATIAAAHAFGLGLGTRFGKMGAGSLAGTSTPPPPACGTGVIDLSTGCALPTFRGL